MQLLVESNELAVTNTYKMHDVAIISKLRLKENNHEITVVNTHINYGGFVRTDIQLLQVIYHHPLYMVLIATNQQLLGPKTGDNNESWLLL